MHQILIQTDRGISSARISLERPGALSVSAEMLDADFNVYLRTLLDIVGRCARRCSS